MIMHSNRRHAIAREQQLYKEGFYDAEEFQEVLALHQKAAREEQLFAIITTLIYYIYAAFVYIGLIEVLFMLVYYVFTGYFPMEPPTLFPPFPSFS